MKIKNFIFGMLIIPLNKESWTEFKFNKIEANKVTFGESIEVEVNKSASPLIHKLDKSKEISSFEVEIEVFGNIKNSLDNNFEEDSIFRIGFVAKGNEKLTGPKKWFAADWVKKMFTLAPPESGLDKIYFFNVSYQKTLIDQERTHPSSRFLHEKVISSFDQNTGNLKIVKKLKNPIDTVALWISIDGDNTISMFKTKIKKIVLNNID